MNDLLNNLHPHYPMSTTNCSELLEQISRIYLAPHLNSGKRRKIVVHLDIDVVIQ